MATQTPKLNLDKPVIGGDTDSWGALLNSNMDKLDASIAVVSTLNQGGFLAVGVHSGVRGVAAQLLDVANRVRVHQFVLPFRTVVGRIVIDIETVSSGGLASVGLYSANGNSLLVHSGALSTTSAGIQTVVLGSSVTTEPGVYVFAWTGDNTTFTFRSFSTGDSVLNIIRENGEKVGNAANPSVAGVLPATLGAISNAPLNTPGAYFEP